MKKPTLCVIFGGKSSEYEVSLSSVSAVLDALDKEKYEIVKIGIDKGGKWYLTSAQKDEILSDKWKERAIPVSIDINNGTFIAQKRVIKPDRILPVMHGEYGEDGRIQGVFECMGLSYVGANTFSASLCMDKHLTKLVAKSIGVPVAKDIVIRKNDLHNLDKIYEGVSKIGYPVFVKPAKGGSSVGVCLVKERRELLVAIEKALLVSDKVIIEEKIYGKENEIAIIEKNNEIVTSTIGAINYPYEFYDYFAKYTSQNIEYIIPTSAPIEAQRKIREYAKKLFLHLGLSGLCRMDFFVTENEGVIFNEVNTLPGFTEISMFPKLFIYDGYTFSSLVEAIINL
ncbi:MAG: D-alanine--D-alanine ligase [Clostridia bacterium]|nr:D-alanine--D-alanine ligase [Clostridia bacterium]